MIGFQSSIIMFPINLLIVSIFRNTRPRQRNAKPDASKQGKSGGRVCPSQSSPQKDLKDISPDTVIKVRSEPRPSNLVGACPPRTLNLTLNCPDPPLHSRRTHHQQSELSRFISYQTVCTYQQQGIKMAIMSTVRTCAVNLAIMSP